MKSGECPRCAHADVELITLNDAERRTLGDHYTQACRPCWTVAYDAESAPREELEAAGAILDGATWRDILGALTTLSANLEHQAGIAERGVENDPQARHGARAEAAALAMRRAARSATLIRARLESRDLFNH